MNRLLLATTNPAKLSEIRLFLEDLPITLVSLTDVRITQIAPENGNTFTENAVMKATFYKQLSGLPTLADDGGFEIDALHGEPGVLSHRWISHDHDDADEDLITHTFTRMDGIPLSRRQAQLRVVLAFAFGTDSIVTAEAAVKGIVPLQPSMRRTPGFPYRSILYLPELGKYYDHAELTTEETETYNHRKQALEKLKPEMQKQLC